MVPIESLLQPGRQLAYGVLKPGEETPNGVLLLKSNQVRDGFIDTTREFRISRELDAEFQRTRLEGGEVLLTVVGSVGRSAVVPASLVGANVSRAIAVLPVRPELSVWVATMLRTPQLQEAMAQRTGGTAQPVLNLGEVRELLIPMPPLAQRQAISSKLDALLVQHRAAREQLEAVPDLVETYRQSVLAAAFRGDLTADWRKKNPDVEPASKLLERIRVERRNAWEAAELAKMTAKGKPPKDDKWRARYTSPASVVAEIKSTDWLLVSLAELASFITDGTHQPPPVTPTGIPFLTITNIVGGRIRWESIVKWVSQSTYAKLTSVVAPRAGDVLYTAVGATFGRAVTVDSEAPFVFQRHIAHIRPIVPLISPEYLSIMLNAPSTYAHARTVARGVAQPTVTLGELREFQIPLRSTEEQLEIVRIVRSVLAEVEVVDGLLPDSLAQVARLEEAILRAAFRGEWHN